MPHAKNVRILANPILAKTVDSVANKDTRITAPVRTTKMADIVNWRGVTCVRRTRVKTVVLVKRVRMGPVSFVYVGKFSCYTLYTENVFLNFSNCLMCSLHYNLCNTATRITSICVVGCILLRNSVVFNANSTLT